MGDDSRVRVGDAEREAALRALGEHMSAGRLEIEEYGERTARVTAARTRGELAALFDDLPPPRPFSVTAPAPPPPRRVALPAPWLTPPVVLALVVALVLLVLTRGVAVPLLAIPAVLYFVARRRR
ncbi:DUF1707 SHOCT-like domain-containing protein [Actinokineospora sp. G85]|uniref:DUF1707 SHOCT-like domain-containing protein n=1 Tax=Actinokineospora sp. G85 TaxID=3406626 RepID=UPI003C75178C